MCNRSQSRLSIEVICRGTPGEMGIAQGVALRDKILHARQLLARLEAFRLQQPRWLPFVTYRWLAEHRSARFLTEALARDNRASEVRLRAIAAGAGVPYRSICLFNALEPLLSSVDGCTVCPAACSAVAATRRRTPSGEAIVARNFDYLPLVQPFYVLRESRPAGGLRSLEFTTAPMVGVVDGMNESGLCIVYDYAFTRDAPATPAAPISIAIADALAGCRTVADAARQIAGSPRWGGGLLMLADAEGAIASLELSSTRSHLRWPAAGEDVLFHTNAFCDDQMRAVQVPDEAIYSDRAPKPLRGCRVHESSEVRDARFRQLIEAAGPLGAGELAALMADHGPEGIASDYTPCVHGTYWFTTACLQFFPRARRMRVAYDTACRAKYQEFVL